ncbi:MAG: hypothetical protein JRN35_08470 [Nitrososphaerota archaeon]|nr:hypothetical protein [Nitrososphaerota archaeon]
MVELLEEVIQVCEQGGRISEESVEINLCKEQSEVLEVLPSDWWVSMSIERLSVPHDIFVVSQQIVCCYLGPSCKTTPKNMDELVDVVGVEAFIFLWLESLYEIVQGPCLERSEHEPLQHQVLIETPFRGANSCWGHRL